MSGGFFNYLQDQMLYPTEQIQDIIDNNIEGEEGCYSKETIEKFKETIEALKRASIMLNRVDYLLSYDDGEEAFNRRWDEDLNV